MPSETHIEKEANFIRARATKEGSKPVGESWIFARYAEPKWPRGPFRRNDILVPLEESSIELWRGVPWAFIERVVALEIKDRE